MFNINKKAEYLFFKNILNISKLLLISVLFINTIKNIGIIKKDDQKKVGFNRDELLKLETAVCTIVELSIIKYL